MQPTDRSRYRAIRLSLIILAITLLLTTAGCAKDDQPDLAPDVAQASAPASQTPPATEPGSSPTTPPTTVPSPSAAPIPAAGAGPMPDPSAARITSETGENGPGAEDSLLTSLFYENADGQEVHASQVLTATVLERGHGAVQKAWWELAAGETGEVELSMVAQQVSPGTLSVIVTPTHASGVTSMGACLPAMADEHFYGLGERFNHLNLAGRVVKNRTAQEAGLRTTYAPATFLLSSRGYGLHLETMAQATFDLQIEGRGCYQVRVAGPKLHLYFFAGPEPQTVIERHAQFIGLPPLPPEWSLGVWKNLIGGQKRVMQDVQRLHDEGVPFDAVWIYDAVIEEAGFGWPWQIYGPIAPGAYQDLPGLVKELHGLDLKVLGYVNPFIYPGWQGYDEARQKGYLVGTGGGQPYLEDWTFGQRAYLDFTKAEATKWWQDRVRYALGDVGLDGAMLDFGEDAPRDGQYAGVSASRLMDNMYPLLYHKAAYEAGQVAKPNDFVFFARAGYSGSQPYTTCRFTGDQVRNWHHELGLASVIPAVLNGSLSGWPYWGPDIAGFFQGEQAVDGPGEKELWIRWTELGALMPTMRDMYGAMDGDPVALWTDDETLAIFRTYARLHTALRPYLYRYAQVAHERGLPIVRPLFLNYPEEADTYALEDQYLLGDDLLVAPVLEPGQTERTAYLPADSWRYYWTGETYEGPGQVTVPAPLGQIPLFIRRSAQLELPPPGDL